MTDQQQIEKAAQIMHDMNGCADPYGTCISTSEYYREMAQALADAGMLNPDLGVALESARHNADMWYRNRNLWQKRAENASHSKPQVRRTKAGEWFLDIWDCCPNRAHLTGLDIVDRITGIIAFDTQPEALAAALDHVREVHTGTVTLEIAPDFSGWHDALNRAHNQGARA